MAISEFEQARIKKQARLFCEAKNKKVPSNLPPSQRVSYDFQLDNQTLYIIQISPKWDQPEQMMEYPIAKLSYVKTTGLWQLYSQDRNLKWRKFVFDSCNKDLQPLLDIVDQNPIGCFGF